MRKKVDYKKICRVCCGVLGDDMKVCRMVEILEVVG